MAIMQRLGVSAELLRPVDFYIAYGVYPGMTEHGREHDDWPVIYKRVKITDIFVTGTPV